MGHWQVHSDRVCEVWAGRIIHQVDCWGYAVMENPIKTFVPSHIEPSSAVNSAVTGSKQVQHHILTAFVSTMRKGIVPWIGIVLISGLAALILPRQRSWVYLQVSRLSVVVLLTSVLSYTYYQHTSTLTYSVTACFGFYWLLLTFSCHLVRFGMWPKQCFGHKLSDNERETECLTECQKERNGQVTGR